MLTELKVKLPEELIEKAETRAAAEGTTLAEVVQHWLEGFAAGLDAVEDYL